MRFMDSVLVLTRGVLRKWCSGIQLAGCFVDGVLEFNLQGVS